MINLEQWTWLLATYQWCPTDVWACERAKRTGRLNCHGERTVEFSTRWSAAAERGLVHPRRRIGQKWPQSFMTFVPLLASRRSCRRRQGKRSCRSENRYRLRWFRQRGDVVLQRFSPIVLTSAEMLWVLDFCNRCLEQTAPQTWSTASMALNFKNGDPADCDNYRPISILCTACKMFAAMLNFYYENLFCSPLSIHGYCFSARSHDNVYIYMYINK